MTESAARNAPHAKPLSHVARLARLVAVAMLIPLGVRAETISYGYDPGNRLQSVECDDGQSVHYVYDNLGNQLIRRTPAAPQANNPPRTVTPGVADGTELTYTAVTLDWSAAVDPDADDAVVYAPRHRVEPAAGLQRLGSQLDAALSAAAADHLYVERRRP
jgi:YD repeat-containing protein